MNRIPQVIRQELLAGNVLAGVVPAGPAMVDSEETVLRGLYRTYTACTAAGLFVPPGTSTVGWRLERAMWNIPAAGGVTLNVLDENDIPYELVGAGGDSGVYTAIESGGLLILPTWKVQFLAVNPVANAANMIVCIGHGLNQDAFSSARILGEEFYPPSRTP